MISSTVHGVLGQRLVRMLCPACKKAAPASAEEREALHLARDQLKKPLMRAVGCKACQGLGFKGRGGFFELLLMNEAIRPLILTRASVTELRSVARQSGMRTLREDGLRRILAGETTAEEALRETQDYD